MPWIYCDASRSVAFHPHAGLGIQAIERITDEYPRIPVIVLADENEENNATEAFSTGVVDILVKSRMTINWMKRVINFAIHRMRAIECIRNIDRQYLNIVNLCPEAIVSIDGRGIISLFNVAAEEMFGYSVKDILGQPLTLLIPSSFRAHHDVHFQRFAEGKDVVRRIGERGELAALRRDGEEFPAEIAISKLQTPDGISFTAIVRDVTERKRIEEQLRDLAMTDPLTGVANRRRFLDVADLELKRSRRYGRPLSILMIDIDRFKDINDQMGHAAGDHTLLRLAIACHEVLRHVDLLARIGGDEFVALLPETDDANARVLAERLAEHIAQIEIQHSGRVFQMTVSIGHSAVQDTDASIEEALGRADAMLFGAKRLRRALPMPRDAGV